ncbi:hypothetical protein RRG08_065798 [Elysia crispata]|uniref:Uncharacterized protein n=1 Tax=Elysia crispata TaxID=231223 RepID=A0AAE0ZRD3_9GAST|nr:hypothetical protein RRG08_065798 [Elysia crispata]
MCIILPHSPLYSHTHIDKDTVHFVIGDFESPEPRSNLFSKIAPDSAELANLGDLRDLTLPSPCTCQVEIVKRVLSGRNQSFAAAETIRLDEERRSALISIHCFLRPENVCISIYAYVEFRPVWKLSTSFTRRETRRMSGGFHLEEAAETSCLVLVLVESVEIERLMPKTAA